MKITATDNGYILENDHGETLTLSAQELAKLVQDGHRLIDPEAQFQLLATMRPEDVAVGIDAHRTHSILRLIGQDNTEVAFEVGAEGTRKLADAFAEKAEMIEAAKASKTEH